MSENPDESFMQAAIEVAKRNRRAPFGSVLVDQVSNSIVAEGVNRSSENPIFHGEIDAINAYARNGGKAWQQLKLYTTAEPCCMCQAAIVWAGITHVAYGTSVPRLVEFGWDQFELRAEEVVTRTPFASCQITAGLLESSTDKLFQDCLKR